MKIACFAIIAAGGFAILCSAAVELVEDKPIVRPPDTGSIGGAIAPAGMIADIHALSRVTSKQYQADKFDKRTGRFVFNNLPGDARYDICVTTTDGRQYQGIDLDFVESRLLRLGELRRKQLNLPPERKYQFKESDAKWLIDFVGKQESFTDIKRVLYVRGFGGRATVLVELMRTRSFHSSGEAIVWRVELWYFRRRFEGWQRLAGQERVLERRRITLDKWQKIHLEYYPSLSAYVDEQGKSKPVKFTIPQAAAPSRGRPAGTKPKLQTKPHVLGVG